MRVSSLVAFITSALVASVAADELQIIKTREVDCDRKTKDGDQLTMHYRGTLEDGTQFDASYDRNQPFSFQLGAGRVIKGWDEGLKDMCVGEARKLIIPYDKAYGERGMGPIPARSTLIFETELLAIANHKDREL